MKRKGVVICLAQSNYNPFPSLFVLPIGERGAAVVLNKVAVEVALVGKSPFLSYGLNGEFALAQQRGSAAEPVANRKLPEADSHELAECSNEDVAA